MVTRRPRYGQKRTDHWNKQMIPVVLLIKRKIYCIKLNINALNGFKTNLWTLDKKAE
jgi:hypothetical protein